MLPGVGDRPGPAAVIDGSPVAGAVGGPGPPDDGGTGLDPVRLLAAEPAECMEQLGTSRRGLDQGEAQRRLVRWGPNVLPQAPGRSVVGELLGQLTNMFAVLLMVAAGLTFAIYGLTEPRDVANLELGFAILAVVALNALIGFVQEHAAERTAEALQAMMPLTARVIRGGEMAEVDARELVPGDLVALEAGDSVPADCRVVRADDLAIEMAALTGESEPVTRVPEGAPVRQVVEARNAVFMGCSVTGGSGRAVVLATGIHTEFGRIYRLTSGLVPEESPLQRNVSSMARRVAAAAVAVGLVLFGVRLAEGNAAASSFVFALGVMVALVPEGLPATLSVSLAIGVRRMARRQALVKKLAAVEGLGSTTVICTDKTGTLTRAEMTLQQVFHSGRLSAVTGVGYSPEGAVEDRAEVAPLLRAAALCCDARLQPPSGGHGWRILGDSTEGALLVGALKAGVDPDAEALAAPRVRTFPFDADRKMMSVVCQMGDRLESYVKGAPAAVIGCCSRVEWDGGVEELGAAVGRRVEETVDELAGRGLRVLAVARGEPRSARDGRDRTESDLVLLGLVALSDPPRPEVEAALGACRRAGIRVFMVTGDYGLTAEAIARRIGVVPPGPVRVVTGPAMDVMDDRDLSAILSGDEPVIFARTRPEHKLRVVSTLQAAGEIVAVTGDGANDAPALKRASIGVAMGRTGTDVARHAAVMVLLDDSFSSIAAAVELGRSVYQNIRHFLVYIFSHNVAELAPILVAVFVGFPLVPLSALQVLSIDLGSDVLPGLALGAEQPERGTMDQPPRPPGERLFSWPLVRRFLFLGGIQATGVVLAFFWRINSAHIPYSEFTSSNPVYREALTMTQVGIIVSQLFNRFTVRSDYQSLLTIGVLSNRPLVAVSAVDVSFALAVSYVPAFQDLFHTAPLSVADWAVLIGFGVILLLADEARKAWHRHHRPGLVMA